MFLQSTVKSDTSAFSHFGCHFCVTPTTKFNTEKWIMRFFKIYCWCCFIGQWVISSRRKIWSMISLLCVRYHQSWPSQNWPALRGDPRPNMILFHFCHCRSVLCHLNVSMCLWQTRDPYAYHDWNAVSLFPLFQRSWCFSFPISTSLHWYRTWSLLSVNFRFRVSRALVGRRDSIPASRASSSRTLGCVLQLFP